VPGRIGNPALSPTIFVRNRRLLHRPGGHRPPDPRVRIPAVTLASRRSASSAALLRIAQEIYKGVQVK